MATRMIRDRIIAVLVAFLTLPLAWCNDNILPEQVINDNGDQMCDTFVVENKRLEGSLKVLPTDLIHQRRYLPKGEPFRTPHAWQKLFFSLSSGLYGLTDKEWQRTNVPVSLSLGYEFSRCSALRLSGTYVQIPREQTRLDLHSFGTDLDYMFNVTNYLHGYQPERYHLNFGIVPGVGIIYSSRQNEKSLAWKAHLGLHLGFNFGRSAEVFMEPWFGLTDDKVNLSVISPLEK